jgi:putative solute:sodium symporter small subunit
VRAVVQGRGAASGRFTAAASGKIRAMSDTQGRNQAWRRHLRWTGALLLLWFLVSFGVAVYARGLSFSLFGSPFSVWIAGQGALVIFVLIVWINARIAAREDRRLEALNDDPA